MSSPKGPSYQSVWNWIIGSDSIGYWWTRSSTKIMADFALVCKWVGKRKFQQSIGQRNGPTLKHDSCDFLATTYWNSGLLNMIFKTHPNQVCLQGFNYSTRGVPSRPHPLHTSKSRPTLTQVLPLNQQSQSLQMFVHLHGCQVGAQLEPSLLALCIGSQPKIFYTRINRWTQANVPRVQLRLI